MFTGTGGDRTGIRQERAVCIDEQVIGVVERGAKWYLRPIHSGVEIFYAITACLSFLVGLLVRR